MALPEDPSRPFVSVAPRSAFTVGFYLVLIGILLYVNARSTYLIPSLPALLGLVLLAYLARYASTRYILDAETLTAWRLFGTRRIRLEDVRSIELANLRDLGPSGLFGTWGWRGRVWSPVIGRFETIHTVSDGLLVHAGDVPLFISPRDPPSFARELSRRARSWGVNLEVDAPPWRARSAILG